MKKQELKKYIRVHWQSILTLGLGTMFLYVFSIEGILIMRGDTPNPFSLPLITFLVLVLWGLEVFRCCARASNDMKETEDKKEAKKNEAKQ